VLRTPLVELVAAAGNNSASNSDDLAKGIVAARRLCTYSNSAEIQRWARRSLGAALQSFTRN
jgi:hypothetical protein